tara:strand:+ start:3013 stop:3678 length:666 start_codon:yes stop_codon:yes gene_type:complete
MDLGEPERRLVQEIQWRPDHCLFDINSYAWKRGVVADFFVGFDAPRSRPEFIDQRTGWRYFDTEILEDERICKCIPRRLMTRKQPEWHGRTIQEFPNVLPIKCTLEWEPQKFLNENSPVQWGDAPNNENNGGMRSTFLGSLRVAYDLGARTIFLLGCDCNDERENRYWDRLKEKLDEICPVFEEKGLTVLNCSKDSALKMFPYCELGKLTNPVDEEVALWR